MIPTAASRTQAQWSPSPCPVSPESSGLLNSYCVKAKETREGQVQLGTPLELRLQESWVHRKLGGLAHVLPACGVSTETTADARKLEFGVR